MPQASQRLRDKIADYFPNQLMDGCGPMEFLKSKGWVQRFGVWLAPVDHKPSKKEQDCIQYLIDEWDHDYGPRSVTV